jgi:ferredoxin
MSTAGERQARARLTTKRWRVEVESETCIGSGICASLAPTTFAVGADRVSQVARPDVDEDPGVVDAASCCPVQAITVRDLATGQLIAPED